MQPSNVAKALVIFIATLTIAGCDQKRPTFDLIIDGKTITLPVHDDPKLIQDDILANIKPLWNDLDSGTSASFQCKRIISFRNEDMERKARAQYGRDVTVTSNWTSNTQLFRFFKGRDGINGLEQMQDGTPIPMTARKDLDWESMEYYLRTSVFDPELIDSVMQFK